MATRNPRIKLTTNGSAFRVTLDATVFAFLATKLGADPWRDPSAAREAVRDRLQVEVDRDPGAFVAARGYAQYNARMAHEFAVREIASPALLRAVDKQKCEGHVPNDEKP